VAAESVRLLAPRRWLKAERRQRSAVLQGHGADHPDAASVALAGLPADRWTVFHDVRWPGGAHANVDHIVVGPPGVFVVDSKNWSGSVEVVAGVLQRDGLAKSEEVTGASETARAVATLLPFLAPGLVTPVLCLVRDEFVAVRIGDVLVWSTQNVAVMMKTRRDVMSEEEMRGPVAVLRAALEPPVPVAPARVAPVPSEAVKLPSSSTPKPARQRKLPRVNRRVAVPGVISLVIAAGLISNPELVTGVPDRVSDFVADVVSPSGRAARQAGEQQQEKGQRQEDDPAKQPAGRLTPHSSQGAVPSIFS